MVDGLGPDVEVAAQERRQRLARATVAGHHVKIDAEGLGGQERAQPPAHADTLDPPGDALDLLQIRDGLVGALGRYVQAEASAPTRASHVNLLVSKPTGVSDSI